MTRSDYRASTEEARLRMAATLSPRARLAFLAKDSAFYGVSSAIHKSFALLTLPILARHFSVADYGLVDLFTIAGWFLSALIVFGQDSAVARHMFEETEPSGRRQMVSQSLAVQTTAAVLGTGVLWFLADWMVSHTTGRPQDTLLLRILALQVPFLVWTNFSQNLLKWTFQRGRFAIVTIGMVATNTVALLVATFWFDVSVVEVFLVMLLVRAVFGALGLSLCRGWLTWPRGFDRIPALLQFGVPFGIITAISTFVPTMERTAVRSLVGPEALGLYAAGATLALATMLPIQAFQTAWGPFSTAIYKETNAGQTYRQVAKGYTLIVCAFVIALVALSPAILRVLASTRYMDGAVVILPLALGLMIQGVGWITEIGIALSMRSHFQLVGYAAFLASSVVGAYFMAPIWGMVGVAVAVMGGFAAKAVINTLLGQYVHPIPWPFGQLTALVTVAAVLGSVSWYVHVAHGHIVGVIAGMGLLLAFLIFGWVMVLDGGERRGLKDAALRAARRLTR